MHDERLSAPGRRRRACLGWLAGLALPLSACSPEPTVSPLDWQMSGARPLEERGAFEPALQQSETELLRRLGAGSGGHPDVRRHRLPADADWASVLAFFGDRLGPGWQRSEVPEQQLGYRLRVWRRGSLGPQLAVALLDQTVPVGRDGQPFRVLLVATDKP